MKSGFQKYCAGSIILVLLLLPFLQTAYLAFHKIRPSLKAENAEIALAESAVEKWEGKHELFYKGIKYDVVSKISVNSRIYLLLISDRKEQRILHNLAINGNNNSDEFPTPHIVKIFKTELNWISENIEPDVFSIIPHKRVYPTLLFKFSYHHPEVIIPPPEAGC